MIDRAAARDFERPLKSNMKSENQVVVSLKCKDFISEGESVRNYKLLGEMGDVYSFYSTYVVI